MSVHYTWRPPELIKQQLRLAHELRQELVSMRLAYEADLQGIWSSFPWWLRPKSNWPKPRRPRRQPQKPPNPNGYSLSGASRAVTPKNRPWQPCSPPTSYQPHHRYERHCTTSTFTSQKPPTRLAYYPKQPENSRQLSKF